MPNFNLPHIFHDGVGEPASGAQVSEDLAVLKEKIEANENGKLDTLKGLFQLTGHELELRSTSELQALVGAPTPGFASADLITFPSACVQAWHGGFATYTEGGGPNPGVLAYFPMNLRIELTAKGCRAVFSSPSGPFWFKYTVYALGY